MDGVAQPRPRPQKGAQAGGAAAGDPDACGCPWVWMPVRGGGERQLACARWSLSWHGCGNLRVVWCGMTADVMASPVPPTEGRIQGSAVTWWVYFIFYNISLVQGVKLGPTYRTLRRLAVWLPRCPACCYAVGAVPDGAGCRAFRDDDAGVAAMATFLLPRSLAPRDGAAAFAMSASSARRNNLLEFQRAEDHGGIDELIAMSFWQLCCTYVAFATNR